MTTSSPSTDAVRVTRDYYNSADAHAFYSRVWGGEDLHLGIYETPSESIFAASRRSVERLAAPSELLGPAAQVLDIGAGFGGTARYLAKTHGCRVTALNLSEVENERNRRMTAEQQLDHLITVVDGSFQSLPFDDEAFDVVWSQDALLHSDDRRRVLTEACRVLRPGGELIFSDPMQADDCPRGVLGPILERIHLSSLGSPGFYRSVARELGFEEICVDDQTENLVTHYSRVLEETERDEQVLRQAISEEYLQRMRKGLGHWIEGGRKGWLAWCLFCFRKGAAEADRSR